MRNAGVLVLALAFAVPAAADEGPITEKDLEPPLNKYGEMIRDVQAGKLKGAQVMEYYTQRAARRGAPRQAAIDAYMYGLVLSEARSRFDEARRQFERAVQLWPAFPAAHVATGNLAVARRSCRGSLAAAKTALKISADCIEAYLLEARVADATGELDKAARIFKRSMEVKPTGWALIGLSGVYVKLARRSIDEEERQEFAKQAVNSANTWVFMEPKKSLAHRFKAQVYLDLGQVEHAVNTLEDSLAKGEWSDVEKGEFLKMLRAVYEVTGHVDGMKSALTRLRPLVSGEERDRLDTRLKDIEEKGRTAFVIWQVEALVKILMNDGIDVDRRVAALNDLLEFYGNDQILANRHLAEKGWEVLRAAFRVLIDAPPEVTIRMMKFLRDQFPDPHLIRILVHFLYPYANERTTAPVRIETVRTLAVCAGEAALPALLFSLKDDDGGVLREVDKALAAICQRRSPVGGGLGPLPEADIVLVRKTWMRYARSEAGAERLAGAFEQLAKVVKTDPAQTRGLRAAPMVQHTVELVLLDNDMPWPAWRAAYDFLVKYWGKDVRPPERRDKPIEEFEREHAVKELEKVWAKAAAEEAAAAVSPPPTPDGTKEKPR